MGAIEGFLWLDTDGGSLHPFRLTSDDLIVDERLAVVPAVLHLHYPPDGSTLCACFSRPSHGADADDATGAVAIYSMLGDAGERRLVHRGTKPTGGTTPCHAGTVGGRLLVANFRSWGSYGKPGAGTPGSVGVVTPDGDESALVVRFSGGGPHPVRQTAPHPHYVMPVGEAQALVADLGSDRVWLIELTGHDDARVRPFAELPRGSGPRHLAASPDGASVYVVNEISCTVTLLAVSSSVDESAATNVAEVSMLADGRSAGTGGSISVIGETGLIAATLRGPDELVVVRDATRRGARALELAGRLPLGGTPGDFCGCGRTLLVPVGEMLAVVEVADDGAPRIAHRHSMPGRIGAIAVTRPISC